MDLESLRLGIGGRILPRTDKQIFAGLGDLGNANLPSIVGGASDLAFRHLGHKGAFRFQVDEWKRIGCGDIVGQPPQFVLVGFKIDNLPVLSAQLYVMRILPLGKRYDWDRPDISLACPLKVEFVEEFLHSFMGGVAVGKIVGKG